MIKKYFVGEEHQQRQEPLKFKYAGFWSRRIDDEHRLIYRVQDAEIQIVKCRFHYD